MKCPCKGCTDRTLTCHGFCDEYKAWKAEREQVNARRNAEQEATNYHIAARLRIRGQKK